jgi:ABC-2 type transport system permease protein
MARLPVVKLLVELKLRLLRNALRSSGQAKAGFIVSTTFAVLVAIITFLALAALRGHSASVDATTVVFTSFAFGWLILPLMVFGLDGTLDPATLALYPLRTGPLAVGLLAASAVGAWPAANLIGLLGVTIGLAHGGLGILFALLAVLLQLLFCITLTRFVTTGLAGLLRSRRGRDLAILLIIPIFALYEGFAQVVPKLTADHKLTLASFHGVDLWLRWLPPGLAAHAIQDASDGHAGTALLRLALLAGIVAALGYLWIRSLGNALVSVDTSTRISVPRGGALRGGALRKTALRKTALRKTAQRGTALPFGRYGLPGAVAGRFWVYQRRDPSSLIAWGITAVIMAAVSIRLILTPNYMAGLITSAIFGAAFAGLFHANVIGNTGAAFGSEAAALTGARSLRAYFAGQDVVFAIIAVPLLTAISFALAAVAKHPEAGFAAMALDVAGIGAGLALGNILSVTAAYPVERRVGSPTPRPADGYRGYAIGGTFGSLLGTAAALIPLIAAVLLTDHDPAAVRLPVLLACAAGYGLALAWAGVRIAARLGEDRLPELSQVALRSKL